MSVALLLLLIFVDFANCEYDTRVITTLKYSKSYVHPTVINGIPAQTGQVPFLVSLKEILVKVSDLKYIWTNICGGSIISNTKVLTAAHCFEGKSFLYYHHPEYLRVVAGNFTTELIHTGNTDTTRRAQWRKIKKVVLHRKFFFPENDLALVFVNEPFEYNINVGHVVIAKRRADYPNQCISAGFGSMNHSEDRITPILLVANMFLLSRRNCSKMWEMNMDKFICTYSFMSDMGRGDSGGPLACKGTVDPAEKKGLPLLVGVVSGKNFDKTTLFTRVSAYKTWIANAKSAACAIGDYVSYCDIKYLVFVVILYSFSCDLHTDVCAW
ncbi:chymotrypsin-1-like [Ostrinia nubilalis]|uniref:chymotrypsin-1-like n=1 Tax=Ostrinia nubilalis TaxID=29057 RepID=UPI0030825F97